MRASIDAERPRIRSMRDDVSVDEPLVYRVSTILSGSGWRG